MRSPMPKARCPECGRDCLVALFVTLRMFQDGSAEVMVDCPHCLTPFNAVLAETTPDPN